MFQEHNGHKLAQIEDAYQQLVLDRIDALTSQLTTTQTSFG